MERPTFSLSTARRCVEVTIDAGNLGALHSVSVWASEFWSDIGAQVATAEKSNEITAIPHAVVADRYSGSHRPSPSTRWEHKRPLPRRSLRRKEPTSWLNEGKPGNRCTTCRNHRLYRREQTKTDFRGIGPPATRHRGKEARSDRESNLCSDARSEEPAGIQELEGTALDRDRLSVVHPRWKGDQRGTLFHQQSAGQGETVCARGS